MKESASSSAAAIEAKPFRDPAVEIIESIDLPVIVIGRDCRISSFNRAAARLFSLCQSDVGQSVSEVRLLSSIKRFEELCANVIEGGAPSQGEVRDANGCWFVLRIAAYKGSDQGIIGAVLTLTNVTAVRESLEQAVYDREYAKAIVNAVIDPLVVLDENSQILTANHAFYALLQVSREEIHGVRLTELGNKDWATALRSLLENSRSTEPPLTALEVEHEFPAIGQRKVLLKARPILGKGNFKRLSLLSIHDITEYRRAEKTLRENEHRFRQMIEGLPAAVYTTDAEGRLTHFNQAAVEFAGRQPELGADRWCVSWKLYRADGSPLPPEECPMAIALEQGRATRGIEAIAERPDGTRVWFTPYPTPLRDGDGRIVGGINMLVDITERKQAEEATARLAAIVEFSEDAIVSKDLNGIITSWNESAARMFGYKAQEAIGQPVTMLTPADRLDEEPDILRRIRKGESVDHYETVRRRKDGTLLDVSLAVSPIFDRGGRTVGASDISRDITARKQAEEDLRAQASLLDLAHDAIIVRDKDDKIVYWNKGAERTYGWSKDEARGKVTHLLLKTRSAQPLPEFTAAQSNENAWEGEILHTTRDGREIAVTTRWAPQRDTAGNVVAVLEINRDVTDRNRAQEALLQTRARYDFIKDEAQLGFWCCDLPLDKLIWDAQVKEHFWVPADAEVTIDTFYERLHPEDRERTRRAIAASIDNRVRYEIENRTVSPSGAEKWIRAIGQTFYDDAGQPCRFDGLTLDVTERKVAENALREAHALLADKAKHLETLVQQRTAALRETIGELEAFSYSISHDMRGPLRWMQNFGLILATDHASQLDDKGKDCLNRIIAGAERLDLLIQDVLTYSQVAKTDLPLLPLDLRRLLNEVVSSYPAFQPPVAEIEIRGSFPSVLGAQSLLTQCISNILGNAVKFVAPGVVPCVRVFAQDCDRQESARILFQDNGVGIAPEHHQKIFGIFERLSKDYEGTGIGLAIVKKSVERMGGRVGLESQLGKGSIFWLELKKAN